MGAVYPLKEALHQTRFVYANKLEVSYNICALRSMPYAGLVQVKVKALAPVDLSVENGAEVPDEYLQPRIQRKSIQDYGLHLKLLRTSALTRHRNLQVSATSAFILRMILRWKSLTIKEIYLQNI